MWRGDAKAWRAIAAARCWQPGGRWRLARETSADDPCAATLLPAALTLGRRRARRDGHRRQQRGPPKVRGAARRRGRRWVVPRHAALPGRRSEARERWRFRLRRAMHLITWPRRATNSAVPRPPARAKPDRSIGAGRDASHLRRVFTLHRSDFRVDSARTAPFTQESTGTVTPFGGRGLPTGRRTVTYLVKFADIHQGRLNGNGPRGARGQVSSGVRSILTAGPVRAQGGTRAGRQAIARDGTQAHPLRPTSPRPILAPPRHHSAPHRAIVARPIARPPRCRPSSGRGAQTGCPEPAQP